MQSPEVWFVCPFSRPQFLDNVLLNFWRQAYQPIRMVIVCNGDADGVRIETSDKRITVLRSEKGLAEPMNVGLEYVRRNCAPDAWFCKTDDDDLYSRNYLGQLARGIAQGADVIGKQAAWIRPKQGGLWLFDGVRDQWDAGTGIHGATITAKVENALDFEHVEDWGEDTRWVFAMRERGSKIWIDRPGGYCYMRHHGGHAFDVSDDELLSLGVPVYDCGDFSALAIEADGPSTQKRQIPAREVRLEDSHAVTRALARMPAELEAAYREGGAGALLRAMAPPILGA